MNPRTGLRLIAVGVTLVVLGVIGGFVFAEDDDGTESGASATTTSTDPEPEPEKENPAELYELLETAFAENDDATLFDRLDQTVLDTYGAEQCRTYLEGLAPPGPIFEVRGVEDPAPWNYGEREGREIVVDDAIAVDLLVTREGAEPTSQVGHVRYEGRELRWFTDCGEPVGP